MNLTHLYSSSGLASYYNGSAINGSFDVPLPGSDQEGIEMVLEPYSFTHLITTSIVLGTMILATIIGNVFVIAAIVLERNLQNAANYLIVSLAVADLMVAALVMPLAAVNEVSLQWFLGAEVCDMWISFDVLCCTSSILHLVAIAMDRYWAVTQVDYIRNRSSKRILIMIALSWCVSACISIPPLFGWKADVEDTDITGECLISQDWGYTVFSTLGAFYFPLLVMIIIYIKIFRAAKKTIRKKNIRKHEKNNKKTKPLLNRTNSDETSIACNENSIAMAQIRVSPNQSPDASTNGSLLNLNDNSKNNNKHSLLSASPPSSPLLKQSNGNHLSSSHGRSNSYLDVTKVYFDFKKSHNSPQKKRDRQKEKLEQKRERKAARTLGIITGSFVCCWLPFFIVALVRPFCGATCHYPLWLLSIIGWLGYFNSLLNPIIYTIFNPDFRSAFRKILFGKYNNRRR